MAGEFTVGVEEEFCIVDARTGELRPRAAEVVPLAGTHPTAVAADDSGVNPAKERYRRLEREFQAVAREQLVNGCHAHVGITDADLSRPAGSGARCTGLPPGGGPLRAAGGAGRSRRVHGRPAADVVHGLLARRRPALEAEGDWDEVGDRVDRALRCGNGAARQRAAYARRGDLGDVLELLLA